MSNKCLKQEIRFEMFLFWLLFCPPFLISHMCTFGDRCMSGVLCISNLAQLNCSKFILAILSCWSICLIEPTVYISHYGFLLNWLSFFYCWSNCYKNIRLATIELQQPKHKSHQLIKLKHLLNWTNPSHISLQFMNTLSNMEDRYHILGIIREDTVDLVRKIRQGH